MKIVKDGIRGSNNMFGHTHDEHFSIDCFAYKSKMNHWNPTYKVFLALVTIIMCLVLNNLFVSLFVIMAMTYLIVVKSGLNMREYISVMSIPFTFLLLATLAVGFDFSRHPAGEINMDLGYFYLITSKRSLLEMFRLFIRSYAAVSALQMMTLTTSSSEIISVLKKMHVPVIVIEMMNMIYRYIFILLELNNKMKKSAHARLGYCDFRTACYSFGSIAGNILVVSLKKAETYYNAMEARCYDGEYSFLQENKKTEGVHIAGASVFVAFLLIIWFATK
ncbi:cobalt ECF transporter T component CbiQ [Parasporobacterium paucivorans]|uniref:Cobalt/nickel transport system permease protein n=1 Tax=Parasporobacterium paucivorans DSM 15970 TaxID=1122934 RepID=A0A1M6DSA1_9FIRM|nr:cobalt ECF transporter T component CbiQ [Parasporobacterium paucivorans]SHI75888.1 cobalt/nickel transport system permease protein [Parasporobacterium paucivorans DSM 15970]